MDIPNSAQVIALMRDVARRRIMPRFRNLSDHDISSKKSPKDLVTIADIEAEQDLSVALKELLPGSNIVGEEGTEADPTVLAALGMETPTWLIDPVDGTTNFAEGRECFAVVVALCVGGETRAGWILDPVTDTVIWAVAGGGAWAVGRGETEVMSTRMGAIVNHGPLPLVGSLSSKAMKRFAARLSASPSTRIARSGSTGREYMELARGTLNFAAYMRLKPWDHAAGVLIFDEVGGYARLRDGGARYRVEPAISQATLLIAPDEATWHMLDQALG